jgi:NADPH2:quinone reductase
MTDRGTMSAVRVDEFGGPEVLTVTDVPVPEPEDGQVLIEVERAGVNMADLGSRQNAYLAPQELPLFPGLEVGGRIVEGADGLEEGQRVAALIQGGGYAKYATAFAVAAVPIPDELETETAVALLLQGLTAWHCIHSCGRLAEGESIVIGAGAGGVGSLAIQLAKLAGAGRVIALASTDEKREICRELGADEAIDPQTEDLAGALQKANESQLINVVLEMTGGEVFTQSLQALAPWGRLVVYGAASGELNQVSTVELMQGTKTVSAFWAAHAVGPPETYQEPMGEVFARAIAGDLRAQIGKTYPLSEVAQAHEDMAARRTTGKLLLDPSN